MADLDEIETDMRGALNATTMSLNLCDNVEFCDCVHFDLHDHDGTVFATAPMPLAAVHHILRVALPAAIASLERRVKERGTPAATHSHVDGGCH